MPETDPRVPGPGPAPDLHEALAAVVRRLDAIESALADRLRPDEALVDTVQSALSAFNTRLGRLEEAFVKAVEDSGSGAEEVLDQVRHAVRQALAEAPATAVAGAPSSAPDAPPAGGAGDGLAGVTAAVEQLGQRVEAVASLLERHVRDTEASLGRRATEVTRRLASDFGLRPRR